MNNAELYDKLTECDGTDVWLPEMEFLPRDKMEYRKQLWNDTFYLDDMTVFAIDGGGALYAWRPDDSVVFIDTGSGECEEFAPDLAAAIYRRIIEFANGDYVDMCSNEEKADMDPDDAEYYTSEDDAVALLKQYRDAFGNFFTIEQKEHIETLISQGFLPDINAFITEEELMRLIRERIKADTAAVRNICR